MKFLEGNPLSVAEAKTLGVAVCSETVLPMILALLNDKLLLMVHLEKSS
jgi:hypothetical protein